MKNARPGKLLILAALSLTTVVPGALFAQEGTGLRGKLSFAQSLEFSDNKRLRTETLGDTFTPVTDLGFDLASDTNVDRLRFSLDAGIEKSFGRGAVGQDDDLRVSSKSARIDYTRFGANSQLSFNGLLTEREVADDFEGFLIDGQFDPTALIVDRGDVRRANLGVTLETGINSPFGLEVRARTRDRKYINSDDPELTDRKENAIDATARFRIRPAIALRALAGFEDLKDTSIIVTETERKYVGLGFEGENASGLSIVGDLTVDDVAIADDGILREEFTGVGFQFSVEQARVNGTIGIAASNRIDAAGRRTQALVSRSIELPTGGLSFSLGLADQDDTDVGVIGSLDFRRDMPLGEITASVIQAPSTDIDEALLNTSINLGVRRALDRVSAVGATFRYGNTRRQFDTTGEDSPGRATIGLTYEREITRDWGMAAGYEFTRAGFEGGDDERTRNTVFFRIGRDFDFGF